jgi:hypothetical protein
MRDNNGASSVQSLEDVYLEMMVTSELPDHVFDDWIWRSDPEEQYSKEVLMNKSQLMGFLVCMCKGLQPSTEETELPERLCLMEKSVSQMSLRELKDTLENLQIEWPIFLERLDSNPNAQANLDAVISLIDQCAARFGQLCIRAYDVSVLDDLGSTEPYNAGEGSGMMRITLACIRRTVSTFMVFYRHLHLLAVCKTLPGEWVDHKITKYHMEASGDTFNMLCMHIGLPVAAKLCYKHDFPGMYNHVSQVAFFHNSEYQRTPRVALENLNGASIEQILPALLQIYPGIGLKYEEDAIDLTTPSVKRDDWFWLVLPRRVYLIDPDRNVWYSTNLTRLLKVYVDSQGVSG